MDRRLLAIPVFLLFVAAILMSGVMNTFGDDPADVPAEPQVSGPEEPETVLQKADPEPPVVSDKDAVNEGESTSSLAPAGASFGGSMPSTVQKIESEMPTPQGTIADGDGAATYDVEIDNSLIVESINSECDCDPDNNDFGLKLEGWDGIDWVNDTNGADDIYPDGAIRIAISDSNATHFNWSSDYPICKVIVKAGSETGISYPGGTSGGPLDAGINPNSGDLYEISHVTFCYIKEDGTGTGGEIPEFPTIALPMLAIIGLAFFFNRKE